MNLKQNTHHSFISKYLLNVAVEKANNNVVSVSADLFAGAVHKQNFTRAICKQLFQLQESEAKA